MRTLRSLVRVALAVGATAVATTALAQADALDKAAKEKGAVKTASGLVYLSQKEGSGRNPEATDTVRVHYKGYFPDGKEFDSSYKRGSPTEFPLNRVIKCWTEGVAMMKPGGKAKLTCPPSIAYGERGAGGVIPPNAVLQFDVELLGIVANPAPANPHGTNPHKK